MEATLPDDEDLRMNGPVTCLRLLHLAAGAVPRELAPDAAFPAEGIVWIDVIRETCPDWPHDVRHWVATEIDSEHVTDSLSLAHPSSFESSVDYDLLIFEGLGPIAHWDSFESRRAAFFMFDRLLITVRSADSPAFNKVVDLLLAGRQRCPPDTMRLTHLLVDTMVDRFLIFRESLDAHLTELQDDLLDPENGMDDWRQLLEARRIVRRLEYMADNQAEALDHWRRLSSENWTAADEVRIRDLSEHVDRIRDHASNLERDVEAAVQLHFAMVGHRTNRIMQTLTVISAIFFPLTLIAGIYGMNFDHMPELHWRYGYFAVLGLLAIIAITLLFYFRRRRYF